MMNRTARPNPVRPAMPEASGTGARTLRALCGLGLLSGLAACADSGQKPTMPATEEAQIYRSHARGHYAEPGPPGDPWRLRTETAVTEEAALSAHTGDTLAVTSDKKRNTENTEKTQRYTESALKTV